ncbi:MAG: alpha/beta hydrolase [Pseudomonadota bacterium]
MEGQERTFTVNGLKLAALEWPGEGLPIIAVHGWLDNAASFTPIAEYLSAHHVLALDLPGNGHSDHLPPSASYHLADNLYWLSVVADEMGWQKFVLLGHSMGAAIACIAAAAMPQRVMGLTLIDGLGPLVIAPELEVKWLRHLFSASDTSKASRPFGDIINAAHLRQKHSRFPITIEAATTIVERNLRLEDDGYHWCYDKRLKEPSTHYYSEEQVLGILATIESPTLLMSAEEGALKRWQGFAERRAALPGLQHQVLPGGHHLHMETPQPVALELNLFYASLKEKQK